MTNSTAFTNALSIASSKGIDFNYEAGTINNRVVRNYGIIRVMSGKNIESETLVNRNKLINAVLLATAGMTAGQAKGMIFKTLEQALFVEVVGYGRPEALTKLPTDIQVANANTAYVIKALNSGRLVTCSLDADTVTRVMNQTELSICPDKKVSKAILIGDGAVAAGVYRNGNTLTSINPLSDATKGITRCNAGFAPKADSLDRVVSNIEFEGSQENFVKEGIAHQAIFVPGIQILAQGMVSVNETKSFDYTATKNFERKFAIETIGAEITSMDFPKLLVHGATVTVNDVVIYTHNDFTEVKVYSMTPELDELGSVWTFNFKATMIATSKTNVKVRDFGSKGMTHRNGVTVAESNDWDLLFTSESIKTSEAIRTMYCQANGNHLQTIDGVLQNINGEEVTSSTINDWYRSNGQYFTVTTPVSSTCVENLKSVTTDVTFTPSDIEGVYNATQVVFGIQTEYLVNIELSSADEIAGFTKTDAVAKTLQAMITG